MNKKKNVLFKISIGFNVLVLILGVAVFIKIGGFSWIEAKTHTPTFDENPFYIERTELFDGVNTEENGIIFIGDSITQRGLWDEYFPETYVLNRGINSDTLDGVNSRLDDVTKINPSKVFIMIGINDLYAGSTKEEILSKYDSVLSSFKKGIPNSEIFIQSILPLNYEIYFAGEKIKNETIKEVNEGIESLAKKYEYAYIDLYPKMIKDNQLDKNLTWDGIHLNSKGYEIWKDGIYGFVQ